jgi:hypothetical protein
MTTHTGSLSLFHLLDPNLLADPFVSKMSAADSAANLLDWDGFHKGTLTAHRLPGDHVTMLRQPGVNELAQIMLESLGKARASTGVGRPVAPLLERGAK